jgi:hypothetical protein
MIRGIIFTGTKTRQLFTFKMHSVALFAGRRNVTDGAVVRSGGISNLAQLK